jgi:hypothetical protein
MRDLQLRQELRKVRTELLRTKAAFLKEAMLRLAAERELAKLKRVLHGERDGGDQGSVR